MTLGAETMKQAGDAPAARLMRNATLFAMIVAIALFIAKVGVYLLTGSIALMGSAIDSGLDILATTFNFIAVRQALQPPDKEHRFGHGKAEAIAGLGQSAFICGSAALLMIEAIGRMLHRHDLDFALAGIAVTVISILITGALVLYQRYVTSRTKSLAISADEVHYRSDIILNLGVLLALVLSGPMLRWRFADPIIGALIAIYIAVSAMKILRQSFNHLMDREFDDEERARIAKIVRGHPEVIALHDLRTRRSGRDAFIQFHLELAPGLNLVEAHRISDEVEGDVRKAFPEAEVLIHEDPAGYETVDGPLQHVAAAR
ncbi:MAG TPA: cation diffusion facilitator family transporter [Alphaproteobacteria bacterium]|nr:cation diffusion facilitator family transporter [Alphaproteobacteria bacterium]